MSARRARDAEKPEPLALTDAEVAAMARGEGKEVARRIARHSSTKPIGRMKSDKPEPPRITAPEMEQIQRDQGRLPDPVRERLQTAGEPDAAREPKRTRKLFPKKEPRGQG